MKLPRSAVDRIVDGMQGVDLGDQRRSARALKVLERMAQAPAASLPAALRDDAEIQGAYRLVNNPAVTFSALLAPQARTTRLRAEARRDVLVLHDTTSCSFPHLDAAQIGYLNTGKAGFLTHLSLVVDMHNWRRPLGVIHAETISRPKRRRRKKGKASGSETAKWSERESARWWRGMEASGKALANCERVVHIADREGDSYELFANLVANREDFIIRLRVDRCGRAADGPEESGTKVKAIAAGCTGLLERDVELSARRKKSAPGMNRAHAPRKKRVAKLRFAATSVVIPRPKYLSHSLPEELRLNLVHVVEIDVPDGDPPVEWFLYTTEPVATAEQVAEVVDNYRTRWLIEEFNAALKTGCLYEERQFESMQALLAILALSLPIACEILWLRSRARSSPQAPATEVLTTTQIEVLGAIGSRKLPPNPTAQDALLAVAALGGHLKRNGAPGWKVLQRGMASLLAHEAGWVAALRSTRRGAKM